MRIPLVDLSFQTRAIASEVREGLDRLMDEGDFILGRAVSDFESAYADFCHVDHCVGVGNGTDALELALRALDVGSGDEVILPANTFIASALAVLRAGARPVLVDADEGHHLIDVRAVEDHISAKTKAILAVDLFGQMADWEALEQVAQASGVALVEDAAQAQGATRRHRHAGALGDVSGTSFYPGKNLGAWGDGGAVTTNSGEVAARLRSLRNYGSEVKYEHPEVGFNSRLDSFQALVLQAKLGKLSAWNELRREAARRYDRLLEGVPALRLPSVLAGNEPVWHIYAVMVPSRDQVLARLNESGIGAMVHYPKPIHMQGAFRELGHAPGDFPHTERAALEMISLPLFPGISEAQQDFVADALKEALDSIGG
ncbi:MAG: DegT/DnrJ/EryC1/StrS family aminotransferase [Myxococcota bacterium]|nr:DegT/DnrJ/EryC1/StrS family aminotransferase [Myxococcota bacterium]